VKKKTLILGTRAAAAVAVVEAVVLVAGTGVVKLEQQL